MVQRKQQFCFQADEKQAGILLGPAGDTVVFRSPLCGGSSAPRETSSKDHL